MKTCWRKHLLHFMPRICSSCNNIECKFTKYSELISCLLVDEQNNELLQKNRQSRPTVSTPFPEANGTSFDKHTGNYVHGRGRGHGHGRNNQYREDRTHNSSKRNNTPYH